MITAFYIVLFIIPSSSLKMRHRRTYSTIVDHYINQYAKEEEVSSCFCAPKMKLAAAAD